MLEDKILSESEIIQLIQKHLTDMPENPIAFGDDVSGVTLSNNEVAILKTDMLIGITDVPPGMSLFAAARKAIVMNISDFAAKGVAPKSALVALGLPKSLATEKAVSEIANGINAGACEYGVFVIGGDTNEASDLVISVTLFGTTKNPPPLRSGARAGDIVAVTGLFGRTSAGLRLLSGNCKAKPSLAKMLIDAVFFPKARLLEGLELCLSNFVSASMDSSDGLALSLHELARMSNVGFLINKVPIAPEVEKFATQNDVDAIELALYGGEEYELVLTVKPDKWGEAEAKIKAVNGCLIPIGKATSDRNVVLETDGKKRSIESRGWEHFKSQI